MEHDWFGVWGRWGVAAHGEIDGRRWGVGLHLDAAWQPAPGVAASVGLVVTLGPLYATVTLERHTDG
jgi:hypothetical protein